MNGGMKMESGTTTETSANASQSMSSEMPAFETSQKRSRRKRLKRRTLFKIVPLDDAPTPEIARDVVSAFYADVGLRGTVPEIVRVERLIEFKRKRHRQTAWLVSVSVDMTYKKDRQKLGLNHSPTPE